MTRQSPYEKANCHYKFIHPSEHCSEGKAPIVSRAKSPVSVGTASKVRVLKVANASAIAVLILNATHRFRSLGMAIDGVSDRR